MEHTAAVSSRVRRPTYTLACAALVCALVSPDVLAHALRAAGALTLEAQPFVALAALATLLSARGSWRAGRWARACRGVAWLGGCGCTGAAGALTPAAFVFCAFTAGWPLAMVRALSAVAAGAAMRWQRESSARATGPALHARPAPPDGPAQHAGRVQHDGSRLGTGPAQAAEPAGRAGVARAAGPARHVERPPHCRPAEHNGSTGRGRSERDQRAAASITPARQLAGIAAAGFAGALLLAALEAWHVPAVLGAIAPLIEAAAGALLGVLSPCTLGAVGLAATLRPTRPAFAAGLLATAGVLPTGMLLRGVIAAAPRRLPSGDRLASVPRAPDPAPLQASGSRWATAATGSETVALYAGLALAATLAASRGGAGIVSPRLTPLLALGAVAALALCAMAYHARPRRVTRLRAATAGGPGWLLAAALTVALAPAPFALPVAQDGAALEDAVAGGRVDFTGVVTAGTGPAGGRLSRWRMTCCIADAAPVVVALAAPARASPGTWVRVHGVWRPSPRGLVLSVQHEVTVPPPRDPYLYA